MTITPHTRLTGLIGWPLGHSYSPAMHNAAAAAHGVDLVYLPLPVAPGDVETAVGGLRALGFRGFNVTVPHKEAVFALLDELSEAARIIGAVNTVVIERPDGGGSLMRGHNTDWSGFLAHLRQMDVRIEQRDCVVLGAGGSARAVVYALQQAGGRVCVFSRRREQSEALVAALNPARSFGTPLAEAGSWSQLPGRLAGCDYPLIVNTTPVGMAPAADRSPWPASVPFPNGAIVYDLVYNPSPTRLLREAAAADCRTAGGLGMLVAQAAAAFELWTGVKPDPAVMRAAITASPA